MGDSPARLIITLAAATAVFAGCAGPQQPPDPASSTTSAPSTASAGPAVRSVIDPRWIAVDDGDGAWRVVYRGVDRDRVHYGLRPADETYVYPNECTACNHPAHTAALAVYARGAFDSAAVRTGEPATVAGHEGHVLPPRWPAGPVLAWQYDTSSWATVHAMTESTGDPARLQEVATRLDTAQREPIRYPLSLQTLPLDMPLTEIIEGENSPHTLSFGYGGTASQTLDIRLWASDEFPEHRSAGGDRIEVFTVPVDIGGRDGFRHVSRPADEAAITVAPGVTVSFELSGGGELDLTEVLDHVVWAPDPADRNSWPAVTDWT